MGYLKVTDRSASRGRPITIIVQPVKQLVNSNSVSSLMAVAKHLTVCKSIRCKLFNEHKYSILSQVDHVQKQSSSSQML